MKAPHFNFNVPNIVVVAVFEKVEVSCKHVSYRLICRPTETKDFQQNNLLDE